MKMRRLMPLILVGFCLLPTRIGYAQTDGNNLSLEALLEYLQGLRPSRGIALGLLEKYSPTGSYIIDHYNRCPSRFYLDLGRSTISLRRSGTRRQPRIDVNRIDFMTFIRGQEPKEIVRSLNTAVHEMCHAYTALVAFLLVAQQQKEYKPGDRYGAFYIGQDDVILARHTETFPAAEMEPHFPESLRTARFATYMHPSTSNNTCQKNGIYGLLDEFNAYYHGTKTAFDLLPFYESELQQTPENWLDFFSDVNGTYFAYLEFKLYLLKYLQYAQNSHPNVYAEVIANKEFREAFWKIDANFSTLIQDYFASKERIYDLLREKGYEVNEDDSTLWIRKAGRRIGRGNFLATYIMLQNELSKQEYQDLLRELKSLDSQSTTDGQSPLKPDNSANGGTVQ